MKRALTGVLVLCVAAVFSCKEKPQYAEPNFVLQKWAKSIEQLNYPAYAACEAYPKSEQVFRDMYKDYYLVDMMTTDIEPESKDAARKDQEGASFVHRGINFEGTIMDRKTHRPSGIMRGNAVFIRFTEGKRRNDGWLMSNRTLIRIDR